jgi:hypothetical protein
MPFVPVAVKAFAAFGNGQKEIVAARGPYVKEIRPPFARLNAFAVNALISLIVVFVPHNIFFWFK